MTGPTSDTSGPEPLFERVVIVDWSANSTPKRGRDSIWVAWFDSQHDEGQVVNVATRTEAIVLLERLVTDVRDGPTLLGVDFSLGFPAGTARTFGLSGRPWEAMWSLLDDQVVDDERNRNNRFDVAADLNRRANDNEGPFWGRPRTKQVPGLTSTKVSCEPLPEWRQCEALLRDLGHRPFSCWQLMGAGAVGSQSLLGIAALSRLRRRLRRTVQIDVDVWPFTTGFTVPRRSSRSVVIAEVWPSLIDLRESTASGRVRDEAQVVTLGAKLSAADRIGELAGLFTPEVSAADLASVVAEEGWVLGAGTVVPGW